MDKEFQIIDEKEPRALDMAEEILRNGGVVVVPTDTVYGIVGDATDEEAVRKIFSIKGRSADKALPIFVRDVRMAKEYAEISEQIECFLKKVRPGRVTIVVRGRSNLPAILTGGRSTIGIRMPNNSFLSRLLKRLNFPLAQTSANISGKPPAKNIKEAFHYFRDAGEKPECFIDGGKCLGLPSTIIDFTREKPIVIRSGALNGDRVLGRLLDEF